MSVAGPGGLKIEWGDDSYEVAVPKPSRMVVAMALARRDILPDGAFSHCTWRCLNREFLITLDSIKDYIVDTWRKYCAKYGVKFYDYCILDNHVHMVVQALSTDLLGKFMRVCNSLIARHINFKLGRDSHALRERYKSPLISDAEYFTNTLAYVWLNYYKATGVKPADYKYGSIFYRLRGSDNKGLLASYDDLPLGVTGSERRFVKDLLNAAMSVDVMKQLRDDIYEHMHSIGRPSFVRERTSYFDRLKKERGSSS